MSHPLFVLSKDSRRLVSAMVIITSSILFAGVRAILPDRSAESRNAPKKLGAEVFHGEYGTPTALQQAAARIGQMDNSPLPTASGPRVSDRFPDVELISHRGQMLRLRTDLVRDRIVCFAMFYIRCKGSCPGTISKVLALRRSLSREFDPGRIHFVCITLDPENDGPKQLQEYVEKLGIKDSPELAQIHFCTGSRPDVDAARRALGMYDQDPVIDADLSQHAAMLLVGNDRFNRWAATPSGVNLPEHHETALRIAGETEKQRFATRFANDSGFSLADVEATKNLGDLTASE